MTNDVDVHAETVIRRPVEEVAAYAGDPANAPEWYGNVEEVEVLTAPPWGVGSRTDVVARVLARRVTFTFEVADFEPGRRLVMRTARGPFPLETTYTWEPTDDGATRMTLRNRGRPGTSVRLTGLALAKAMKRAANGDLARLRERLESRAGPLSP